MSMKPTRIQCPKCKVEMNHHADKLVYLSDARGKGAPDPDLGGVVQSNHCCPRCGETRSVQEAPRGAMGG